MKNLGGLMKQAQQMQAKMQEMQAKLEALEITGESGAGLVRVTLNGKGEMKGVKIDPKLADPADMEMLEDLVVAAHRDAKEKIDTQAAAEMQKITGGMQPVSVQVPLDNKRRLKLLVTNALDGSAQDRADWGNAQVTCAP